MNRVLHKNSSDRILYLYPIHMNLISELRRLGLNCFAIFGGSIRDADLNRRPKDYDVRAWLTPEQLRTFLVALKREGIWFDKVVAGGTKHFRYLFEINGQEIDFSFRHDKTGSTADVAIDRIKDADCGISAVALDMNGVKHYTQEYLEDIRNDTLTFYPIDNPEREKVYIQRMTEKFPEFSVKKA